MKVLSAVVLFTLLMVTSGKRFTEDMLLPIHKECINELGLNIQTILDSVDEDFLTVEGDTAINKYCECSLKKLNALDENNALNFDSIRNLFINYVNIMANRIVDNPDQVATDGTEYCKGVEGSDVGDQFVKFLNCFVKYVSNI